jgi:hypothetical protein
LGGSERFVEVIQDVSETGQNHATSSKPTKPQKTAPNYDYLGQSQLYLIIDKPYSERDQPTSMEENPEDFEPMAQYQGIYLINYILVEEHDASTRPAGRY